MPDPAATDIPARLRRRPELWMVLLFLVSLAALGFFLLAGEVVEGDTASFDEAILLALRNPADLSDPIGSHWVEEMARDMTALGGVAWLSLLTAGVAGYLALSRHTRTMWFLLIAIGSGTLLSRTAKIFFERARPDLVPHGSYVYTASFPSGHTMLSAVTYLTLAVMLSRLEPRRIIKVYIMTCAIILTGLVGASRVYLGVHWPTDVIAGWTAGAGWAVLCLLIAQWLQRRGQIEPAEDAKD
ncbi:MAG: phosphatase PAP2 family protein [Limimaricola soesokkakensis]|uniref:Phosphatidylglycerophosphatase B n=1 Tax=Limimaricola soesokkakensis TaxID=1343159 RepID=A0A1X6ZIF3_9RHOB|nr:phosphatase PAP2 family protein [Limimaricola soesokkakensis]PSK84875.1 undecaprenyl-diphosphatase [Limimaricola soesokkakensis]SLN52663.1 phosphatidylglycerophosphatase B [Limimaricola soesokkakensis]